MRVWITAVLLALLVAAANADEFKTYDAAAVKRVDDALRRLGIQLPSLSKPDEPIDLLDPVVSSSAGDFEGYWTKSQFGRPIAAFEGIPYAQPPLGPLRFKLAQPLTSRLTEFKAKEPGSKCLQRDLFLIIPGVDGSDDCLFLNIYVPEKVQREDREKLPVMFFIHGGGYVLGQSHMYRSNVLLDKDVVLVTFNYRLGPLGFLTTGDDVIPANLGLKDQVAALHWVHENIAPFGGDPNLITVFGHSAGAASTDFMMTSPLTKGLIHRVIAMSGSSVAPYAISSQTEMADHRRKAAQHLGCPAEPSQDLLSCLQTKTSEEITEVDFHFRIWGLTAVVPFKPVVEGNVPGAHIPQHPNKLLVDGPANDVPYMTGITSEEGVFFLAPMNDSLFRVFGERFSEFGSKILFLTNPEQKSHIETVRKAYFSPGPLSRANMIQVANLFTDIFFFWPALKSVQLRRQGAKCPSYFYYFSSESSRSFLHFLGIDSSTGNYGVTHGDDLFYLFTLPTDLKPSPRDVLSSIILTDIYSSFARDGVPSSKFLKTKWQPVSRKGSDVEYVHFKSPLDIRMEKDLLPERRALMQKLFENGREHDEL